MNFLKILFFANVFFAVTAALSLISGNASGMTLASLAINVLGAYMLYPLTRS